METEKNKNKGPQSGSVSRVGVGWDWGSLPLASRIANVQKREIECFQKLAYHSFMSIHIFIYRFTTNALYTDRHLNKYPYLKDYSSERAERMNTQVNR